MNVLMLIFFSREVKFTIAHTHLDGAIVVQFGFIAMQQRHAIDKKRPFPFVCDEKIAIATQFDGALSARHFMRRSL